MWKVVDRFEDLVMLNLIQDPVLRPRNESALNRCSPGFGVTETIESESLPVSLILKGCSSDSLQQQELLRCEHVVRVSQDSEVHSRRNFLAVLVFTVPGNCTRM